MVDTFQMRRRGTQLIDTLVHGAPNDYERPAIAIKPVCRWNDGPTATSFLFAEAGHVCG